MPISTPETGAAPETSKAKEEGNVPIREDNIEPDETEIHDNGFRYPTSYRNKLLKGSKPDFSQKTMCEQISGNSQAVHRIQSAETTKSSPEPQDNNSKENHSVYVGHIHKNTTEDNIRAHVADIGIQLENITEVKKLKCKSLKMSLFCISVNAPDTQEKLYDANNWPMGVRIRQFHPANDRRTSSQPSVRSIRSAMKEDPKTQRKFSDENYFLYVGRIARNTSEEDMRSHIANIGIPFNHVADVIKLK